MNAFQARAASAVLLAIGTLLGIPPSTAQPCEPEWRAFDRMSAAYPGADGRVSYATTWDPDGSGPRTEVLVLGGDFTFVGGAYTPGIAAYDPATNEW